MNAIIDLSVHVPKVPEKTQYGIEVKPHERDFWTRKRATVELGGKTLREKLASIMDGDRWKRGNNEQRAKWMEEQIQRYHDKAEEMTKKEFKAIQKSIDDAEDKQRAAAREGKGEPMPTSPLLRSLTR